MHIYLIRHGEDLPGYRGGWSRYSLTNVGRKQIIDLSKKILEDRISFDHIISSDLPRALESAEILSEQLKKSLVVEPLFREYNNGLLAGLSNKEADERFPGLYFNAIKMDEHFPEGESPNEYYARINKALDKVISDDKDVIIVTHGGVIDVISHILNHIPWSNNSPFKKHYDNASITHFEIKKALKSK